MFIIASKYSSLRKLFLHRECYSFRKAYNLKKHCIRTMSQPLSAITGGENVPQPTKMQKVENEPLLRVKKLSDRATIPVRGSAGAAGYDLSRCVLFSFSSFLPGRSCYNKPF